MLRRMFAENALPCALSYLSTLGVRHIFQYAGHFGSISGKQDLLTGCEEILNARPGIGKDSCPACRGFKQPDRWRIAGGHHIVSREVKSEAARRIKSRMIRR